MKIYISGYDDAIRAMWQSQKGCHIVSDIKDADIVQFIGGPDLNPRLYGEECIQGRSVFSNPSDERDIKAWNKSTPDQLKVGICRGGQFLNVINGGALWQHVEGHQLIGTHSITDVLLNRKLDATSTHHQMMIEGKFGEVLAYAEAISKKHETKALPNGRPVTPYDPEVVWYEKSNSLCFQPHPEFPAGRGELREYYFELINLLRG